MLFQNYSEVEKQTLWNLWALPRFTTQGLQEVLMWYAF